MDYLIRFLKFVFDHANGITAFGTLIAAFGGLGMLGWGIYEYSRQNTQKRAELFRELRSRFQARENLQKLRLLLSEGDPEELAKVPFAERKEFLAFLEEVALSVNSKLLSEDVAFYMFGYYAAVIDKSNYFWNDIPKNHWSWLMTAEFCKRMGKRLREVEEDKNHLEFKNYKF